MRVLLLVSAAVSGALALIMVVFLRGHQRHPGFLQWTVGTAMVSLTYLIAGLRGLMPDAISVLGVNVFTLATPPLFLDGYRRFLGLPTTRRVFWLLPAAALLVCVYFLVVDDDVSARTVTLMLACSVQFLAIVVLAVRHRPEGRTLLVTALASQFAVLAAAMIARAAWVPARQDFSLLLASPAQYAFFGLTLVLHLGITVTLILLTTERVALDLARAHAEVEARVIELQQALAEVRTLHGLLPICASCKRIRDEDDAWIQMEVYVRDHSHAEFSHGLCPECLPKYFSPSLLSKAPPRT